MTVTDQSQKVDKLVNAGDRVFECFYPSLYLDVRSPGRANWIIRYQIFGKRRQAKIGSYGTDHDELLNLEAAIRIAIDWRKKINDGIDPKLDAERQKQLQLVTFDDCANKYLEGKYKKIQTAHIYERIYRNEIKPHLGNIRIDRIHSFDIDAVLKRVVDSGRLGVAKQTLHFIKRVFRLATKYKLVTCNLAQEFSIAEDAGGGEFKRQRFLEEQEIETAFTVFREHPNKIPQPSYIGLVLLLMLGTRKMELLSARWSQVDIKRQTFKLFAEGTKTAAAIVIPIPDLAIPLFHDLRLLSGHSDYLFPKRKVSKSPHIAGDTVNSAVNSLFGKENGNRKAGPNYMGEAGVEHFVVHDLRRTFRTLLSKLGVPRDVAEKCMNHRLKGVEQTYDCYGFFPERIEALNKLAEHVMPLVKYTSLTEAIQT